MLLVAWTLHRNSTCVLNQVVRKFGLESNVNKPVLTCPGYRLKRISERPHKHVYCTSRDDQEDGRLRLVKDGWKKVDEFKEVAQKLALWSLE